MIATLMGTGLSAAAGLNAYIPFVLMGLVARFRRMARAGEGGSAGADRARRRRRSGFAGRRAPG